MWLSLRGSLRRFGVTILLASVYELEILSSRIRGASPREPTLEEAADRLSPAAFKIFALSAAANRTLIAAFLAALAARHMELLTMRENKGEVVIDQKVRPFPRSTHWSRSFINRSLM